MTQMLIPNWLLKTKKVDNEFCKLKYIDTLDNKLGILPFLSLEKLREELDKLNITTGEQYRKYRKDNKVNWPSHPDEYYNINWLELFRKTKQQLLSLEELREELEKLNITTQKQYGKYRKEHNKINWPSNPDEYYNIKWRELFGKIFLSLEELREELDKLNITTKEQYRKYRKKHNKVNWPSNPDAYHINWRELFGKIFLSLEELREELEKLNITTQAQYRKYRKEHNKINWPSVPDAYHINWRELFGK